jgi:hypothetical protein
MSHKIAPNSVDFRAMASMCGGAKLIIMRQGNRAAKNVAAPSA